MIYHVICVSCSPVLGKESIYKRISPHWLTISKHPSIPSWMSPAFLLLKRFVHAVPAGICKTTSLQVWVHSVMQTNTGITTWGPPIVPQNARPKQIADDKHQEHTLYLPLDDFCINMPGDGLRKGAIKICLSCCRRSNCRLFKIPN